LLPREAPWLAAYVAELLAFPNGAHDDQVDSTSQALSWLSRKIAIGTPPVRPNPKRPPGAMRPGAATAGGWGREAIQDPSVHSSSA
jgi:hypothetical protein